MLNFKIINPKWFTIILMLFLSIIIFNNNISKTFCDEEYQIAQCPNNLYLSSYYVTAENNASAISAVENILLNNNFNLDDYEIIIENNIIKIIEKEKQEIEEIKKAETEETTTIQDNNLEIKNENVEFNDNNNEVIRRNIPIEIPELIDIHFDDEKINYTLTIQLYENDEVKLAFVEIQNAIDNNYQNENVKWKLKDEDGNTLTGEEKIQVDIIKKEGKEIIDLYVEIVKETTEEGGTITSEDIKELKEIGICICVLLAINFIYNFTNSMLRRN